MFTCECVLAAAILVSPATSAEPTARLVAEVQVLRPSLLALALDAELLDPREKGFVMSQDALGDLAMLQGREIDLRSAPLLGEAEQHADRKTINELLAVNRQVRNQLTARLSIDLVHAEELRTAIQETDQLYQVWDAVRDARCDYYYVTVRRQALQLLRDLVGAEAFYTGRMPPHVPV